MHFLTYFSLKLTSMKKPHVEYQNKVGLRCFFLDVSPQS